MQSKKLKCTERGLIQPHHSALLKSEDMAERGAVVSCHEKKEENHKDKKTHYIIVRISILDTGRLLHVHVFCFIMFVPSQFRLFSFLLNI